MLPLVNRKPACEYGRVSFGTPPNDMKLIEESLQKADSIHCNDVSMVEVMLDVAATELNQLTLDSEMKSQLLLADDTLMTAEMVDEFKKSTLGHKVEAAATEVMADVTASALKKLTFDSEVKSQLLRVNDTLKAGVIHSVAVHNVTTMMRDLDVDTMLIGSNDASRNEEMVHDVANELAQMTIGPEMDAEVSSPHCRWSYCK